MLEKELQTLIKQIYKYLPDFNEKKFREVFSFAKSAHEGQKRKSDEPYLVHPFETVKILVGLRSDEDTLIAAMLHDVPEDTSHSLSEIEERFGEKVSYLVDSITKLSKVYYRYDMEERQIESLKKLLLHSAKDVRVILVKLADRLHNMRTINYIDNQNKCQRISKETLEIYVPIANLLGIEEIKRELEDLCFECLMPQEYVHIKTELKKTREWQQKSLDETVMLLKKTLKKENVEFEISGREKSLYSIFKKILRKGTSVQEGVNDFLALRIIVNDPLECYKVLGIIHGLFKPMFGCLKDYIAVPKNNGYQSLHTTVFGIRGARTEFQIRTHEMHLEAEYGIASHYFYDQNKQTQISTEGKRAEWVKKILDLQRDQQDNKDFIENLKIDIFQDKMFIFTPKGDVIDLPRGATAVDFAYAIHTDVGNRALKAEVNGESFPLTAPLKSGDTVKIIVSQKLTGPNREWLLSAKTSQAKSNIRAWLRKESREDKYTIGRQWLQTEFDRTGLGLVEEIPNRAIKSFLEKYPYATFDDVIVAIGEGSITPESVLQRLFPEKQTANVGFFEKIFNKFLRKFNRSTEDLIGITIIGEDRVGQLQKITTAFMELGVNIVNLKLCNRFFSPFFKAKAYLSVKDLDQLRKVFENLERIEGVMEVRRFFVTRKLFFSIYSFFTVLFWIAHLCLIYLISHKELTGVLSTQFSINLLLYAGLGLMFILVFYLKKLTKRSFQGLRQSYTFWLLIYLVTTFILFSILIEAYWLSELLKPTIYVNWVLICSIIFLIYAIITIEYFVTRKRNQKIDKV